MRRLALFAVHPKDLADLLRGDIRLGIPEGTKIVDIRNNFHRDMVEIKLEHESFPEVEPGTAIPTRAFNMICVGEYGGYRVPEQFRKGFDEVFTMSHRAAPTMPVADAIISRAE